MLAMARHRKKAEDRTERNLLNGLNKSIDLFTTVSFCTERENLYALYKGEYVTYTCIRYKESIHGKREIRPDITLTLP